MSTTAPSDLHPLRALLIEQGRTVVWLARALRCRPQTLYDRFSGHRSGAGSRGPAPWVPRPVLVLAASKELGVTYGLLAEWLSPGGY